jgi:hypothetical protein
MNTTHRHVDASVIYAALSALRSGNPTSCHAAASFLE